MTEKPAAKRQANPNSQAWREGYHDGRAGEEGARMDDVDYRDGWITGEAERGIDDDSRHFAHSCGTSTKDWS